MSPVAVISCESREAYIDGELSVAESAAFDKHVADCSSCQREIERQLRLRARLRSELARPPAGDSLRRRILSSLPQVGSPLRRAVARRQWIAMAAAASFGAILAGSTTFQVMSPSAEEDWQESILTSHLRATLSGHIIDVASSDRHTVKPWFGGKTEVAPVVMDLTPAGYQLVGGRLDIPQKAALPVLVYKAGPHVISVFVRAGDAAPNGITTINGFSILSWSNGGLTYSAVSDADRVELVGLQRAFADALQQLP